MKSLKVLLLHILISCASQGIYAVESMPIIAFLGIPFNKSTDQNFKDFSDCGFNVSLYGYESLPQLVNACNVAQKYGVRILGHCPETHANPSHAAKILKNNKGFFGYFIQDEPSAPDMIAGENEIRILKSVDTSHCFYINLHPYYDTWTLDATKTKTYSEYLEQASRMSCQQISFDYYPITKDGIRDGWYNNLEQIRKICKSSGKPMWGFVLSVPHAMYPQPNMASLRLQVYSNLSYGAQAIQYFTYWTPPGEKPNDYHNGPITHDGKKTKTYYLVKRMNKELRSLSPIFLGAEITSVNHIGGKLPKGTKKLSRLPKGLSSFKIISKKGAVVSQFRNGGNLYMCVVNKDYEKSLTLCISARNKKTVEIQKDLTESPLQSRYEIQPGDIRIFKLQ